MTEHEFLTTSQVAEQLRVPEWRVHDALRRRLLDPAPPIVSRTRLWTAEDVQRLRAALAERDPRRGGGAVSPDRVSA